jgi:two-component system phosphate regulon sensor histidine kinase PhoR
MLVNLLQNAVNYTPEGGKIAVEARKEEGGIQIEVTDSGIGIPSEDLPRIFERFYRVDKGRSRELGGTGLGLSIVKHIAEAHGGRVSVESKLGQGSRFKVFLPH